MDLENKIEKLEQENDDLKDQLFELQTNLKYSRENDLRDFLRTLYREINEEIEDDESKLSKEDILKNMKKYISVFSEKYNLPL